MSEQQIPESTQEDAVGYLRVDKATRDEIAGLEQEIAAYCERAGLHLTKIFCDRGYDGSQLARPGIVEARNALKESETASITVVVPTLNHLSPAECIRSPLLDMIHNLGGKLVVIREANGAVDASAALHGIGLADNGEDASQ